MIREGGFMHTHIPKGAPMPQTVEDLQYIMEQDALKMRAMAREISELKEQVNRLQQKLSKARKQGKVWGYL